MLASVLKEYQYALAMGLLNFLKFLLNSATGKPIGSGAGSHSQQPKHANEDVVELSFPQHEELWAEAITEVLQEKGIEATVEVVPKRTTETAAKKQADAQPQPNLNRDPKALTPGQLEFLDRLANTPLDSGLEGWVRVVGPIEDCVAFFLDAKLIEVAPLSKKFDLKYRAVDLKPLLKAHGLKTSGKKETLIESLVSTLSRKQAAELVYDMRLFDLTPCGSEAVRSYEAAKQEKQILVETGAMSALRHLDIAKAIQVLGIEGARRVGASYLLHAGCDDLLCDVAQRREAAATLAMSALLGETVVCATKRFMKATGGLISCPKLVEFVHANAEGVASKYFGSDDLESLTPHGLVLIYVHTKLGEACCHDSLSSLKTSCVCKGVQILNTGDCPHCTQGKNQFTWAELHGRSPLPRHWGCTCTYIPWLD